jgi:hypothetical protein
MKFAIRNIISELIGEIHNCEVFESVEDIVAIVNYKDDISGILETIKFNIKRFFGFTVTIGVGNRHTDISELYFPIVKQ